jgi:hypothetical protein
MEKIFDIVDGKVQINVKELTIPSFKKIYDSDKSKEKLDAFNKISYIIFMYKWSSPYASYIDFDTRNKIVKKDIFGDENWEPDVLTKEAVIRYRDFQNNFSLQFLEQNMTGAKKLMEFYTLVNWEEEDKSGKFKYSSRDLAANLKEAGNILKSLESLKEQVRREELETSSIRGGSQINTYEDAHSMSAI